MADPSFFIENQIPGSVNTHTDITPEQAAASILKHVRDGVTLARKHRLPRRIEDFILEHHGTMLTRYQYMQAVEARRRRCREGGFGEIPLSRTPAAFTRDGHFDAGGCV